MSNKNKMKLLLNKKGNHMKYARGNKAKNGHMFEKKLVLNLYNENGVFNYNSSTAGLVHRTLHRICGDATIVSVYCKPEEEEIWKKKLYLAMQEELFKERRKFHDYATQAEKEFLAIEKVIKTI
jgi:hypothetical protein